MVAIGKASLIVLLLRGKLHLQKLLSLSPRAPARVPRPACSRKPQTKSPRSLNALAALLRSCFPWCASRERRHRLPA
jgi:hypothetical protein